MMHLRSRWLLSRMTGALLCCVLSATSVRAEIFEDAWGVLLWKGQTAESNLGDIGLVDYTEKHNPREAIDLEYPNTDEIAYGVEFSRRISRQLPLFRFIEDYVNETEAALTLTYRESQTKTIYEVGPGIVFRWRDFRWDKYVRTTVGFSEGVSYASDIPDQEETEGRFSKHFMNLLTFEVTLAPPNHPQAELSLRIHHRSAGYGLYGVSNTSSNILGVGARYRWGSEL
mgnify:CR=1 FL=1